VRQDLRAQQLQKRMAADQERIELLGRRVQELRFRLAAWTEYTRVEPRARGRGLRPAQTEQVLAVATRPCAGPAGQAATELTDRLVAGLLEFLGPQTAQAEARDAGEPAGAERTAPRAGHAPGTGGGR
jgi:hypothetical protein